VPQFVVEERRRSGARNDVARSQLVDVAHRACELAGLEAFCPSKVPEGVAVAERVTMNKRILFRVTVIVSTQLQLDRGHDRNLIRHAREGFY
jgi:hypothetical protein